MLPSRAAVSHLCRTATRNQHLGPVCFLSTNKSYPSQSSVFGDIFSSIRTTAADVLTSSLSQAEREELLNRLNPPKPEKDMKAEDDTSNERSIAEAVAEARAKEAQLQEEKW